MMVYALAQLKIRNRGRNIVQSLGEFTRIQEDFCRKVDTDAVVLLVEGVG